jgi:hypothetical protein
MAAKKTATTTTTKTSKAAKKATPAVPATPAPSPPAPNSPVLTQPSAITGVANDSNQGSKVELQTSYAAFITGLQQFYQPTDLFDLPTGVMTRDEVIAEFQRFITAAEKTKASNKVWRTDVQTERAVALQVAPIRRGVRSVVTGKFGADGAELLQFGVEPRKPPKKTAATKALAVQKMLATRKSRGTKGSVQKKDIHGTVPDASATPSAPAAAEAPAAPAAATTATKP